MCSLTWLWTEITPRHTKLHLIYLCELIRERTDLNKFLFMFDGVLDTASFFSTDNNSDCTRVLVYCSVGTFQPSQPHCLRIGFKADTTYFWWTLAFHRSITQLWNKLPASAYILWKMSKIVNRSNTHLWPSGSWYSTCQPHTDCEETNIVTFDCRHHPCNTFWTLIYATDQ